MVQNFIIFCLDPYLCLVTVLIVVFKVTTGKLRIILNINFKNIINIKDGGYWNSDIFFSLHMNFCC